MNYARHYDLLVDRARNREIAGYVERHHIIPRCIDKTSTETVRLTPEEHYTAHLLLVKMYPGHRGLIWAAMNMTGATRKMQRSNKIYGWMRRKFSATVSEAQKGRLATIETRERQRLAKLGTTRSPHSEATKIKMRAAATGKVRSAEHCAAIAAAKKGQGGRRQPWSAEDRKKLSKIHSKRWTPELRLSMAETKGRLPLDVMLTLPLSRLSAPCREIVKAHRLVK